MAVPLYCHRQHGNESVSSSRRIPLLEGGCALGLQQPSEPWDGTPSLQDPPGSYIQYWETLQMLLNTASDVCAVRWGSAAATSMWTISFVLKMHTYIYRYILYFKHHFLNCPPRKKSVLFFGAPALARSEQQHISHTLLGQEGGGFLLFHVRSIYLVTLTRE